MAGDTMEGTNERKVNALTVTRLTGQSRAADVPYNMPLCS